MIQRSLLALLVSGFALAASLDTAAARQTRPDFGGAWKMNHAKSHTGPGFHPIASARFAHAGEEFAEELSIEMPNGGARKVALKYTTDGKERDGKVGGKAMKLTAAWDGGALVIKWADPVQGYSIERRLALSADGKTAEMTLRETFPDRQNEHKIVLEKQ